MEEAAAEENVQEIDLITLYALCDKSHAPDRALWRGFFGYVIVENFGIPPEIVEHLIENGIVSTSEDLINSVTNINSVPGCVQRMSSTLCISLSLPPELGLSAFFEGNLPTRTYPTKFKTKHMNDEEVSQTWLNRYEKIRFETFFQNITECWKEDLAFCLEEMGEITEADNILLQEAGEYDEMIPEEDYTEEEQAENEDMNELNKSA